MAEPTYYNEYTDSDGRTYSVRMADGRVLASYQLGPDGGSRVYTYSDILNKDDLDYVAPGWLADMRALLKS